MLSNVKPTQLGIGVIALNVITFFIFNLVFTEHRELFIVSNATNENIISLLFANFNHAGIIHLALNMLFVYCFCESFDRMYSKTEQVLLYLFSGVLVCGLSYAYLLVFDPGQLMYGMVGFSGVCFFMLGSFWMRISNGTQKSFALQMIIIHAVIIAVDVKVAWYAHLFGFMTGFLYYHIRYGRLPRNRLKPTTRL